MYPLWKDERPERKEEDVFKKKNILVWTRW